MGLKIDFTDKTRSNTITANCYIKAEKNLNGNSKAGSLELHVWTSKDARNSNSRKINQISIPVSKEAEVLAEDGCVENINYYDVEFKTGVDFYSYIKSLKIRTFGTIINMNNATNWK